MAHRLSRATLVAPLLIPLTACGPDVKNDEASECIFDAVGPKLQMSFDLATLGGQKFPKISMNKAKVKDCVKSGPSTFDCLVEYSLHLDGTLPKTYSMLSGIETDDAGNINFMANWRFIRGTNATRCQILE